MNKNSRFLFSFFISFIYYKVVTCNRNGGIWMSKFFKSFDDNNEANKFSESKEFKNVANDKNVNDFINNPQFKEFKEKYNGKSEDEILKDAKNMSKKLKEQYGEAEYNKKIQDLKNFEKFLSPEQKKKMKKFLDTLK